MQRSRLCWNLYFRSSNLDGENRQLIFSSSMNTSFLHHPFAVSVFDQFLFWTDWDMGTVNRVDKRNGKMAEMIYDTSKRPMDVHVVHPLRQLKNVENAKNGQLKSSKMSISENHRQMFSELMISYEVSGCFIMLLTNNGDSDYSCHCPTNFFLADDGKTCEPDCPAGNNI